MSRCLRRAWDAITPWPSAAERKADLARAIRTRDAAVQHAMATAERAEKVRRIREQNGFRTAVEMNFRGNPTS